MITRPQPKLPINIESVKDENLKKILRVMEQQHRLIVMTLEELGRILVGSATWNPGSIADGDEETTDVTVTGVALGDFTIASFSLDVADLVLTAQVTVANVVTVSLANNTGGAIDLGSGTVYVKVFKR